MPTIRTTSRTAIAAALLINLTPDPAFASGSPMINCKFTKKDAFGNVVNLSFYQDRNDNDEAISTLSGPSSVSVFKRRRICPPNAKRCYNVSGFEDVATLESKEGERHSYGTYTSQDRRGRETPQKLSIQLSTQAGSLIQVSAKGPKVTRRQHEMRGIATLIVRDKLDMEIRLADRYSEPVVCVSDWQ